MQDPPTRLLVYALLMVLVTTVLGSAGSLPASPLPETPLPETPLPALPPSPGEVPADEPESPTDAEAEAGASESKPGLRPIAPGFHAGVCWVGASHEPSLAYLKKQGVQWISVTPFAYGQKEHDEPPRGGYRFSRYQGESIRGVRKVIRDAHAIGLKVIIKPHIWFFRKDGKWRGDIAMTSDEDWNRWFRMYQDFLNPFLEMAKEEKVSAFCVGTELTATLTRADDWRDLIRTSRKLAPETSMLYSANWYGFESNVTFWDSLDAIGILAYFPISAEKDLDPPAIARAWKPWLDKLRTLSEKERRPILLTEFGYRRDSNNLERPWEWNIREHDPAAQARAFAGARLALEDADWLGGIHVWKWYAPYVGVDAGAEPPRWGHDGFSPQGHPAESTILEWFRARTKAPAVPR